MKKQLKDIQDVFNNKFDEYDLKNKNLSLIKQQTENVKMIYPQNQ
jgi:hypothetical protein